MSFQLFYVLFAAACLTLQCMRPMDEGKASYKESNSSVVNRRVGKNADLLSEKKVGGKDASALAQLASKTDDERNSDVNNDENSNDDDEQTDTDTDEIPKAKRLRDNGIQACYNELTVLGDINDDGAFTPQEWFDMFVKLDSVSHQQNWKLSEDEWRAGLPNCDFGCFQMYSNNLYEGKTEPDENLDWYEWRNAMKLMDQQESTQFNQDETDFLLEEDELSEAGLSGYQGDDAGTGSPGIKDSTLCKVWDAVTGKAKFDGAANGGSKTRATVAATT